MATISLENYEGAFQLEVGPSKVAAIDGEAAYRIAVAKDGRQVFEVEHVRSAFSEHRAICAVAMKICDACAKADWNSYVRCSVFSLGLLKFKPEMIQCRFFLLRDEVKLVPASMESFWSLVGNCREDALFQFGDDLFSEADNAYKIDDAHFVRNLRRRDS